MAVYTTIDNPELYFQSVLWTGNGSNPRTITFGGEEDMQPNLLWYKCRSHAVPNILLDSVRTAGNDKELQPDDTTAEGGTSADADGYISAFTSNGFTLTEGSSGDHYTNEGNRTFVAWGWKASGSTASNTDGTNITSTVDANTTSGFSIVSWTGDNSGSSTVGHGLGKTAEFLVIKNRADASNWQVKHKNNSSNSSQSLDATDAQSNRSGSTNGGIADLSGTTTFGFIAGSAGVPAANGASDAMIAYVWNSVQGYSSIGTYEGNGNADGTFIHTGFRPAWVMFKGIDAGTDWYIYDFKRRTFNVNNTALKAQGNDAEFTSGVNLFDGVSNGIKIRGNGSVVNTSGNTYIYIAFAEAPFVNSNGVPCNAR
tara:strand:- start:245 stop:1351 length:1107 start_codon:yes stop_codon:yes gene_type:complete